MSTVASYISRSFSGTVLIPLTSALILSYVRMRPGRPWESSRGQLQIYTSSVKHLTT